MLSAPSPPLLASYHYGRDRMSDRRVTQTQKDPDGDILGLCNPGQPWSPRRKADAISDIRNKTHSYYVNEAGFRTEVKVVDDRGGAYLQTTGDATSDNNLDNLPDC